ncbi:RING finger protein 37 [Pseudomyrmex gracilis]|uniref:RING finger protein 37 n=1 Tax=Pseudomyrmex gracilis TaxID=219809 RepID=UPI0009954614|nr:RING finger protein 37 [Pseudomyrmex gracilis]
MYLNFCDSRLCSNIRSDTICTDGYEVTNLITDPEKGFLAYSTIKPPVHIEITFECSVRISHILIWPSVGSQKSSGFILSTKTSNTIYERYTPIANAMLTPHDKGVLFYLRSTKPNTISTPPNFVKHIMKARSEPRLPTSVMSARVLRITITKTEKSVPALRKVEVWGRVSPICGPDVLEKVRTLLNALPPHDKHQTVPAPENVVEKQQENQSDQEIKKQFEIPKDFLDPITWEIMTQPVLLPSGNVIDESTLEKFEQNENIWGRAVSDPFTGIPFDNINPILLPVLKSRIDKFLLENSDKDEIKKMPRVLGHSNTSIMTRRLRIIPKCLQNNKRIKRTVKHATLDACKQEIDNNNDSQQTKRFCHQLPAVVTRQSPLKQSNFIVTKPKSHVQSSSIDINDNLLNDNSNKLLLNNEVKLITENVDSIATSERCECCENCILYKLPCRHKICRKQLLSAVYKQCTLCGLPYKSNEVERIHTYM